jgi:hypothetical protein
MIVPRIVLPPATPFTLHTTPVAALPAPEIVAVKTCAPPVATLAVTGETVTVMLSVSMTVADAAAWGAALLTAVTVTATTTGRMAGATYKPAADIVPEPEFPPVTPFTRQVTLVFELPVTNA